MEIPWAMFSVFGAIGLLYVVLRLLGARSAGGESGLRVVESCALGPKSRLHVVEVDGERLLVGGHDAGIVLLRDLGEGAPDRQPAEDVFEAPPRRPAQRAHGRPHWLRAGAGVLCLAALLGAAEARADESDGTEAGPQLVLSLGDGDRGDVAPALELLALLTVVSVAPSILLMATCFTRIVIVLAFLRQAVGVQHLPPNQVLVGLAMFLTVFVMAPTGQQIYTEAWQPYAAEEIELAEAGQLGLEPIRRFMMKHTREADLALFTELSEAPPPEDLDDVQLHALLPAFLISELRTAFEIGFMVFLPFLIIDLVISSMLISMGMIVLPPVVVSLPFKIMLFVLADGWNLVLGSLVDGLL